jgi:hypothetical protein
VSVGALVQQVGEVLGRAHSLLGGPPAWGGVAAIDVGSGLTSAGDLVRSRQRHISGLLGHCRPCTQVRHRRRAGLGCGGRHRQPSSPMERKPSLVDAGSGVAVGLFGLLGGLGVVVAGRGRCGAGSGRASR